MPMFDAETIERLKSRPPREAYAEVKTAILAQGGASHEFQAAFDELVGAGVLSWSLVEQFERE